MNPAIYRAFRFRHPAFDVVGDHADEAPGLSVDASGQVEMAEGDASIRQALLVLLSTTPGERIMRPTYGCDLHRLAFAINDATTEGLAMHYVRRAIERWEPRVELLRVDAQRDLDSPGRLNVAIDYRVRRTQRLGQLDFGVSLTPELHG